jgi:hypothetical protein
MHCNVIDCVTGYVVLCYIWLCYVTSCDLIFQQHSVVRVKLIGELKMNLSTAFRQLVVPTVFLLSTLAISPSHAEVNQSQRYICSGAHGDESDLGLWDGIFNANNEADAINQAKIKFMPPGPGGVVSVFFCRLL